MLDDKEKWRQILHIEPPQGWLNDPNGLCYFNGKYHVYFQYSPESPTGDGDRGWGHYESIDLVNWEFTGYAIRPDTSEDKDGAYSGSAVVYNDKMYIFYTGNVKEEGEHDYITSGRGANVICVTTEDGVNMSSKRVLLTNSDYPDFCSCHVRDPKVWYENGKWRMVLGARTLCDEGSVLYYSSDDLEHWNYDAWESTSNMGYMWECPDCFKIDEDAYLSISPQGLVHESTRFQNVYQSGYFRGEHTLENFEEWDYGFDFYAPQTFEAADGRRILIGWMGIGDIPYKNPTVSLGWQHCLTLPREITKGEDGLLLQNPIRELDNLRCDKIEVCSGNKIDIKLPFDLTATIKNSFEIVLADSIVIKYDVYQKLFTLKFMDKIIGGERQKRLIKMEQCNSIRMIADKSSIEIYLNGGEKVLSTRFYPDNDSISVRILATDAVIYTLRGNVTRL